jgi:hypothetical protein
MGYGGTSYNRSVYATPPVGGSASIRLGRLRFPRLIAAHFASPGLCFAKPLYGPAKRRKQPERSQGESTYCPLENDARIIVGTTPKFAQTLSGQYPRNSTGDIQCDLQENHSRSVSCTYIQQISQAIGDVDESVFTKMNLGIIYDNHKH